jgi:TetR/AcrR family transcriptional regulator, transcriptional repressor for nem operon
MAGVRQFDEDEALEKALTLFWGKGFEGTSMQELAVVTGIQRGSLYNAYQGKETLFLRVFDRYRDRFLAQMRQSLEKPRLRDALRSFFDFVIDSMTTGLPTRGCLSTKTALAGDSIEEPIREVLQTMLDGIEGIVTARLSRGEKGVELMLPPEDAARLIVTFTRGLVVIERVYQDKARLHAVADNLSALLLGAPARKRSRGAQAPLTQAATRRAAASQ